MSHDVPKAGGSAGTGLPVSSAGRGTTPVAGTTAMPEGGTTARPIEKPPVEKPVPPMPPSWTPLRCQEEEDQNQVSIPSLQLVKLTEPVDYFAIYRSFPAGFGQVGMYPAGANVAFTMGEPCAKASMRAGCETALMSLGTPNTSCKDEAKCSAFFLTNIGDEVTRSDSRAAFIALLGPIDTAEKAILVTIFDEAFAPYGGATCSVPSSPNAIGTETRPTDGGFEVRSTWEECGAGVYTTTVHVGKDGTLMAGEKMKTANSLCSVGRRPAGLQPSARVHARTQLGAFLAAAARLEAASVFAFERLARELAALNAPEELIADAARSALDEIRHAELVTALALRFGSAPAEVSLAQLPERGLFAIALENAIEGCVRETYGALLAEHQAQTAQDPEVRAAMAVVAADELRHALLAWRVAEFLEPKLTAEEREQLAIARAAAVAQLLVEETALSPSERAAIGWPEQELERRMVAQLGRALGLA